ncbi:hypothetical protein, partial [Pelagibius sp.]|uniref:hypothetical protein n=1 Tax=Pelagibius sp. TaxID=1931238 RepID=UPI0026168183
VFAVPRSIAISAESMPSKPENIDPIAFSSILTGPQSLRLFETHHHGNVRQGGMPGEIPGHRVRRQTGGQRSL